MPTPPLHVSFWRNVDKTGSCWLWTAKRYSNGYGSLMHEKRYRLAHRIAWELVRGAIPEGLFVCHTCDTPACVNPEHLFLGTPSDNAQDMLRKKRGRPPRGTRSGKTKLSDTDVREIRRLVEEGALQKNVASRYGLSRKQVSVIVARKQWGHVA